MDIFGKYLLARNAETRQGQNMLAMAQQTDAINKDRKLRNILSEAYTPAIPAESRMGPAQPGQPLQPTRGRMDMGNALGAMYEGGFGPEAMAFEQKQKAQGGGIGTYNPRDYTPESWAQFVDNRDPGALKRYTEKTVNLGGVEHLYVPGKGFVPLSTLKAEVEAGAAITGAKEEAKIDVQTEGAEDLKFSEKLGTEGGKIYTDLQKSAQKASTFIPRLEALKELASKVRTGTGAEIQMIASRALGIESANMEVLNAKLGELAQDILNEQTGTKTDFDFANAVKQSAALGKTPEANAALINALINRQQQAVDFGNQAKEAYKSKGVKGVIDMRYTVPRGTKQQGAPQAAIDYLKNNNSPAMRKQFQTKYGYIPD